MVGPAFTAHLERLYERLPEHYRDADGRQDGDYPLKRFLALLGDQAGALEVLVDRIDFIPEHEGGVAGDTSDLVDPDTADVAWLPWLGQLLGAQIAPGLTDAEKRDLVRFAPAGWRAGNKQAVADAAKTVLTGTKYAQVYDHSTDVSAIGAATQWDVLIVTRTSETPDPALVIPTVIAKRAKPAGVELYHRSYEGSWGDVSAEFPTWADWNGRTWAEIQEAGL